MAHARCLQGAFDQQGWAIEYNAEFAKTCWRKQHMGLENREYMREEDGYSADWRGGMRSGRRVDIVATLIITNIIVFLLQHVEIGGVPVVEVLFQLDPELVVRGQVWRLTTYDFLHATGDLWHIFFNMFGLWVFGGRLQERLGWQEFLAFYLVAGAFSGVGYVVWCALSGVWAPCIGASGAVAGAIVLYALYWPYDRFLIYGIIPVQAMWLAIVYAVYDLYPVLMELSGRGNGGSNIAHAAHLAGMLFAVIYVNRRLVLMNYWPTSWGKSARSWFRRRPQLKVLRPDDAEPAPKSVPTRLTASERQRMDDLLDKINSEGEASLTAAERDFLQQASRKLRASS
jgi:membrane associated rhomboid family serine protease